MKVRDEMTSGLAGSRRWNHVFLAVSPSLISASPRLTLFSPTAYGLCGEGRWPPAEINFLPAYQLQGEREFIPPTHPFLSSSSLKPEGISLSHFTKKLRIQRCLQCLRRSNSHLWTHSFIHSFIRQASMKYPPRVPAAVPGPGMRQYTGQTDQVSEPWKPQPRGEAVHTQLNKQRKKVIFDSTKHQEVGVCGQGKGK